MSDLSYTQEFYLCAVNAKGKFPWTNEEALRCLLAGATMELLESGVIARDAKGKLHAARAWGDDAVAERLLGDDSPYHDASRTPDPLARPAGANTVDDRAAYAELAPEPTATGEPGAYLKPLFDAIAGFPKAKGVDGLVEFYLFGVNPKPFARLVQAIGASLWDAECADQVPGDDQRYAPRRDATMRVIEKIRAEVLEAGSMPDDMVTLVYLLDRANIIRDYFSKIDAAALKARLKEVRASAVPSPAREVLDKIDQVSALMVAVAVH